jgi:hypothetical protein
MKLVPDDELERLAAEHGPDSYQAIMLADLRARRAKDEQVHCFQLGEFLVVCPMPTPEEEAQLELAYEATKHMKGSKLTNIAHVIAASDEAEKAESICWVCDSCSEMVVSDDPTPPPSRCMFCGGTTFKKSG